MEELVDAALTGTARGDVPESVLDGPLRDLLPMLPPDPASRLLLAAGLTALYDLAGQVPRPIPAAAPAPPETLPSCSKEVAEVLTDMLQKSAPSAELRLIRDMGVPLPPSGLTADHDDLLPGVLELLQRRGLRLRHVLLPSVLSARPEPLRRALLPVIGERGRWLAQFNPLWSWVSTVEDETPLSPQDDTVWEEGKLLERLSVLQRQRRLDPAGARERLAAVFASEKADARVKLLDALAIGLSADDEPFLESVLDDRQAIVRRRAAELLADVSSSACAQRVRRRLDSLLAWTHHGTLTVTVPAALDPTWEREGLEPAGRLPGLDSPGTWLFHTARLVPVRHTVHRCGVSVEELVGALGGEYDQVLLEAWTRAATHYGEIEALPALWDAWWERRELPQRQPDILPAMLTELAAHLLPADLTPRLQQLLATPVKPWTICGRVLRTVASPWPAELSRAYLDVLRQTAALVAREEAPPDHWLYALLPGARGIAPEFVADALSFFPIPEPDAKSLRLWYVALLAAEEKLQLRRRLIQEFAR